MQNIFYSKNAWVSKPWNIFFVTAGFSNLTESGLVYVLDKNILSKIATSQFNSFSFFRSFWDNKFINQLQVQPIIKHYRLGHKINIVLAAIKPRASLDEDKDYVIEFQQFLLIVLIAYTWRISWKKRTRTLFQIQVRFLYLLRRGQRTSPDT